MRWGELDPNRDPRYRVGAPHPGGGLLARFEACPKCHGQYRRDGWVCHCYQCCFEWDLREPQASVLARARRKHWGQRPGDSPWVDPLSPVDRDDAPEATRPGDIR